MTKQSRHISRRTFVREAISGAGGMAAACTLSGQPTARAGPSEPGAGGVVTPDPVSARIQPSGLAAVLLDFCTPPPTSATAEPALLNYMFHAGDGSGRLFANDARGKLWSIGSGGTVRRFLNLAAIRGDALISGGQRGLRSFAFHPNLNARQAGLRRFYTASTETVAAGHRCEGAFRLLSSAHDNVVRMAGRCHHPVEGGSQLTARGLRIAQPGVTTASTSSSSTRRCEAGHAATTASSISASATAATRPTTRTPAIRRRTWPARWARSCASPR